MKLLVFCLALLTIFSCQNEKADNDSISLSDSVSIAGFTGDSVKLVKKADLRLKVANVAQTARQIASLSRRHGGMIFHQNLESVETETKTLHVSDDSLLQITAIIPQANITARIPSEHLETFIQEASAIGYLIVNSRLDIEEESLAYLQNNLKSKVRNVVLANENEKVKVKSSLKETVSVSDEMIDQQITNQSINADVRYSLVDLQLFQNAIVHREMRANNNISVYKLPFGVRLKNAFASGLDYFLSFVVLLTELWLFIVFGVAIYILYKIYNRNKKSLWQAVGVRQ